MVERRRPFVKLRKVPGVLVRPPKLPFRAQRALAALAKVDGALELCLLPGEPSRAVVTLARLADRGLVRVFVEITAAGRDRVDG